MKKIISLIMSCLMVLIGIENVFAIGDSFQPKNTSMYEKYIQHLEISPRVFLNDTIVSSQVSEFLNSEDYSSFSNLLNANIPNNYPQVNKLDSECIVKNNQKIASVIARNEVNDSLIYIEVSEGVNYILFVVEGEVYKIYLNGLNLLAETTDEKTMYLLKSEIVNVTSPQTRASSKANTPYSTPQDSLYTKDVGPMSKTNKELVYITGLIGEVGQTLAEYGILSPTIGTASMILQIGVSLYDYYQVTYYIRYWHSYKLADTSSWRSKNRYFSDSSYNNWIKDFTTYFETSRPDW